MLAGPEEKRQADCSWHCVCVPGGIAGVAGGAGVAGVADTGSWTLSNEAKVGALAVCPGDRNTNGGFPTCPDYNNSSECNG